MILNPCISCSRPVLLLNLYSEFTVDQVKHSSESLLQGSIKYHKKWCLIISASAISPSTEQFTYHSPVALGMETRLHTGTPLGLLFRLLLIPCHSSFIFLWAQLQHRWSARLSMPSKEAKMKGMGLVVSLHQPSLSDSIIKKQLSSQNIKTVTNIQLLRNWTSV